MRRKKEARSGKMPTSSALRRISLSLSFIRAPGTGQPVVLVGLAVQALDVVGEGVDRPISTRLGPASRLRRVHHWFACTDLLTSLNEPAPSGSTDTAPLLRPLATHRPRSQRSAAPTVHQAAATAQQRRSSHHLPIHLAPRVAQLSPEENPARLPGSPWFLEISHLPYKVLDPMLLSTGVLIRLAGHTRCELPLGPIAATRSPGRRPHGVAHRTPGAGQFRRTALESRKRRLLPRRADRH